MLFFALIIGLIISKKLPAIFALPILAVGVALIAGVPLSLIDPETGKDTGILSHVVNDGVTRLATSYAIGFVGAWIGQLMNQTGITKQIVKFAAELGGDRPLVVSLVLCVAIAFLYTTVGGIGAMIMIATIVIPIFISVGIPNLIAACIYLFALACGVMLNLGNWVFYADVTGVNQADVQQFAFIMVGVTALGALVFLLTQFKKNGIKFTWKNTESTITDEEKVRKVPVLSYLTPIIPLFLVLMFKVPIAVGFYSAALWCFFTLLIFSDYKFNELMSLVTKAAYDGVSSTGPSILLMVGIGMLLNSLMHPIVTASIQPLLEAIIPTSKVSYILFFSLLAPLALYRGPLNLYGLGSGIAVIFITMDILPAAAIFGAFLAAERMQVICCPTNSYTVWLANYVGEDVNKIMLTLLPYVWVVTAVRVIISSFMFF